MSIDENPIPLNATIAGEVIDKKENIYSTIATIALDKELASSENIEITVEIDDVYFRDDRITADKKVYEGQANFKIRTSDKNLNQYTHRYTLNEHFSVLEVDYYISEMIIHPLMALIEIQSDNPSEDYQLLEIRGTDEKGQAITFTPYQHTQSEDQLNMRLHFSEEYSELTVEELYNSEVITLQFYSAGHPIGTDAIYEPYGNEFKINLKMHAPE